jgi:type II secretory pathway pseudopilin PulG
MMHKQWTYLRAFTLAELIITLAVIGSVSIALVPMISSSMAGPQRFRASLRTLITQMETGLQNSDIQRGATNNFQVFTAALRPQRTCPNNSSTEGCWNPTIQGITRGEYAVEAGEAGMILKNGASVVGINNGPITVNGILVDVNGIDGPNQPNVDQLALMVCLDDASCAGVTNNTIANVNPTGEYKGTMGSFFPFPESVSPGAPARFNELME